MTIFSLFITCFNFQGSCEQSPKENVISMTIFHCVKSVEIRGFSGPNTGKNGPEKLRIWTLFE